MNSPVVRRNRLCVWFDSVPSLRFGMRLFRRCPWNVDSWVQSGNRSSIRRCQANRLADNCLFLVEKKITELIWNCSSNCCDVFMIIATTYAWIPYCYLVCCRYSSASRITTSDANAPPMNTLFIIKCMKTAKRCTSDLKIAARNPFDRL